MKYNEEELIDFEYKLHCLKLADFSEYMQLWFKIEKKECSFDDKYVKEMSESYLFPNKQEMLNIMRSLIGRSKTGSLDIPYYRNIYREILEI